MKARCSRTRWADARAHTFWMRCRSLCSASHCRRSCVSSFCALENLLAICRSPTRNARQTLQHRSPETPDEHTIAGRTQGARTSFVMRTRPVKAACSPRSPSISILNLKIQRPLLKGSVYEASLGPEVRLQGNPRRRRGARSEERREGGERTWCGGVTSCAVPS